MCVCIYIYIYICVCVCVCVRVASPSLVSRNRAGRSPLRSRVAPSCLPSQKVSSAGPSHGSCSPA